jgi:DNA mismatch repair ATPase MutS
LLDTARTEAGEETLAGWLRRGAPVDEVRARQAAVDELRPMIDFREELSVLASETPVARTGVLAAWAAGVPTGFPVWVRVVFASCAVATITLFVAAATGAASVHILLPWLLVPSAIGLIWRRQVRRVLARADAPERELVLLSALLERIERESFASARLTALRDALATGDVMPSRRIAALARLVSWADSTRNQLFAPVALVLMLRSQLAAAIDRWHANYGPGVGEWLRVVGELEALAALATYAYEHPSDPFPTLVDEPLFDATALRHPLLSDASSVQNDVRIGGSGPRVVIVSGSNMSGKSTLLRAIGVNVVLAQAGAPVRAVSLRMSPLSIGATLRIEDSLQAGRSRFYAEILRIRDIVELARGPVPALFLLDEILHGTNSYDRRIGAEAIIGALVGAGAIGLVTTHDLALTELVPSLGAAGANVHFEDRLENGAIVFDYRMRPGVVEHSNALALMRAVGLDV